MGNKNDRQQHYDTAVKTGILVLMDEKLTEVPAEVIKLGEIVRSLDLSKNKLTTLPDDISKLKRLKLFNLEKNRLQALPDSLVNLKKLDFLNLSDNLFTSLPLSLSHLTNLKQIKLNNNDLKSFPQQLIGLPNLELVELTGNKITMIPIGMKDFYATELNLNQNEVSQISEDLHKAPRLKILKLEENCLTLDAIKPSLLRDSKLHTLKLDGNLFESKQLVSVEGYNEYTERYTAMKKKMF